MPQDSTVHRIAAAPRRTARSVRTTRRTGGIVSGHWPVPVGAGTERGTRERLVRRGARGPGMTAA